MGVGTSKDEQVYLAVQSGNQEKVKELRRAGASLEWIDKEGRTPLILACTRGELLDMAVTLLNLGANIEAYRPGSHRGTPLHHAAKRGNEKTVTLLLSRGANPWTINDEGLTPLQMARNRGHVSIVRILEEHMCIFSGTLREISGFRILEAISLNLATKKIWAVVLENGSKNHSNRMNSHDLALYPSSKVAQPKVVIPLSKAEIEVPKFNVADPVIYITDKNNRIKYKFLSEKEGDKAQLENFYKACKGIINVSNNQPASPQIQTQPDDNGTDNCNGWSTIKTGEYNGWGATDAQGMPETKIEKPNYGGWETEQMTQNGWVSEVGSSLHPSGTADQVSNDIFHPQPSAPPLPEDTSSGMCVVCWDSRAVGACVPCGHMAGCMDCLSEIQAKGWGCPVCRVEIQQIVKVYAV